MVLCPLLPAFLTRHGSEGPVLRPCLAEPPYGTLEVHSRGTWWLSAGCPRRRHCVERVWPGGSQVTISYNIHPGLTHWDTQVPWGGSCPTDSLSTKAPSNPG